MNDNILNLKEIELEIAKRNYAEYVYMVHEGRWIKGNAINFLCLEVQKFIENETKNAYDILIVSMPPQHGKSMAITETLPSWYLIKNPTKRVIEVSYSEDFAQLFGRRNRQKLIQFGKNYDVELAKNPNNNTEFELSNNIGGMISRGVGSGVTGRPANLMIIDDPIKNRQEADSETYRARVYDEWQNSFKTRLSAGAKVILIQTRWHEDDLAGRLIKEEKNVKIINLPCEAEKNDILDRQLGEALFPEIGKDNEWLKSFKQSYQTQEGSRAWSALFQGRPTSQEGNIIKREWWKYYTILPKMAQKIMSVDATFKDKDDNDFVAIQVWGKINADMYLIDRIKAHLDFPKTLEAIRTMKSKHGNINGILIEDKANGSAIIQVLKKEIPGIIAVEPKGGKIARVNAICPAIESGNVYVPQFGADEFINECSEFPNGKNDDEVDCMSQALARFIFHNAKFEEKDEDEIDNVQNFLNFRG